MNDESGSTFGFNLHITLAMAVSVLRSVVSDFGPDYTYTDTCVYVTDNADGSLVAKCIVGQAFARWGILRVLIARRSDTSSVGNGLDYADGFCNLAGFDATARAHLSGYGITLDDEAFQFLREAQGNQDGRMPWGEAITAAAEKVLTDRGQTVGNPLDRLLL